MHDETLHVLTCIIPGLSSPKVGIDVYLQPLIDDLKRLWVGEWTYNVSNKTLICELL